MRKYLLKRFLLMFPTLLGVAALIFFIMRVVPGDIVELRMMGDRRLRLEMNVLNLFNQQTTRHIFNCLNRGCGAGGQRLSSAIDLSKTDLTKGYDYNALILKTPEGAGAYDPRYGQADLFEEGTRAYFTVKFLF